MNLLGGLRSTPILARSLQIITLLALHSNLHAETLVFDDFSSNAESGWQIHDASGGHEGTASRQGQGILLQDREGQSTPGVTIERDLTFSPEGDCYQIEFSFEPKSIGLADDSSGSQSSVVIYFNFAGTGADVRVYGDRLIFDPGMKQYQVVRFGEGRQVLSFLVNVREKRMRVRRNGTPVGLYHTRDLETSGIRVSAMGTEETPCEFLLQRIVVADAPWDNRPHTSPVVEHDRRILPAEWPAFLRDPRNTCRSPLRGTSSQLRVVSSLRIGGDSLEDVWAHDIDADGRRELIVADKGVIRAVNLAGDEIWQAEASGKILGFYDLDGDGRQEMVLNPLVAVDVRSGRVQARATDPKSGAAPSMRLWKIADVERTGKGLQVVFLRGAEGYIYGFEPGQPLARLVRQFSVADVAVGFTPSLVVADMDGEGPLEIVYVTYDGAFVIGFADGQPRMLHHWNSGRNYADLVAANIDGDPYPELVVQATALREHLAVLDNDGSNLSLRYDHFYEQNYPDNAKDYDVCLDSVRDFDGDGDVEVLQSLYNNSSDGRWHALLLNAVTGEVERDFPDCRAEAVISRGGGTPPWILLAHATGRNRFQGVKAVTPDQRNIVVSEQGSLIKDLTDHDLPPDLGRSPVRGVPILRALGTSADKPNTCLIQEEQRIVSVTLPSEEGDEVVREAFDGASLVDGDRLWLAEDLDGDERTDFVVSRPTDSLLHVLSGRDGRDLMSLPIQGVRRLATAALLQPDDGQLSTLVVDWNNNLLMCRDLKAHPTIVWTKAVQPRYGYHRATSSVMAHDFDGDGSREILAGLPGNRLAILDRGGNPIRTWQLDNPVYEWAVGNFNGNASSDIAVTTSGSVTQYRTLMFDSADQSPPIWQVDLGPYMGGPAAFDTNQDGIDDYICRYFYMRHILDGRNGLDLQPIPWRQGYHAVTVVFPTPEDPEPALLFHSGSYTQRLEKLDGTVIWEHLVQSSGRHGCVGDFEGNGRLESACQTSGQVWDLEKLKPVEGDYPPTLYLWDLASGEQVATCRLDSNFQDGLVSVDLDSDGRDEVVGGTEDGRLIVLGIERGELVIESSLQLAAGAGRPTVVDLDLDGGPEILVGCNDGRIYVLECATAR